MDFDKRQSLYELTEVPGFKVLLEVLEDLVRDQESLIIRYDINTRGVEGLLHLKLEAQGARKFRHTLETYLKKLRLAASEA